MAASLALSVALHCLALSLSGQARLFPQKGGGQQPTRLLVDISRQAVNKEAEEAPNPAIPPVEAADTGRAPVPQQPGEVPEHAASPSPPAPVVAPSGILAGPWYYTARYLHRRPTPLKPIRPIYPPEMENISGRVTLLLLINESGAVDTYRIVESQPPGLFDDTVINAFGRERYAPGLITGYPVKSQLLVEVIFEPGAIPTTSILPGLPK